MEDYAILAEDYLIKRTAFKKLLNVHKIKKIDKINKDGKNNNKNSKILRKLKCPVDNHHLISITPENIIIDYCPGCYGIWFDPGELELLLNKKIKDSSFLYSEPAKPENDKYIKKCPVCKKNMIKKKNYYSDIFVDVCNICGGLWLDSGEFAKLYMEKNESIKNIFKDVLGKYIDIKI